jgi:hypothetical protein
MAAAAAAKDPDPAHNTFGRLFEEIICEPWSNLIAVRA